MSAAENLAPQIISRVMGEIRQLVRSKSDGIEYVNDTEETHVSEVHAIITGPEGTPYAGGKFRMKLVLSAEYPSVPPRGYFLTKIYHPNVSSIGDICVNTLKKDWVPETTLQHVSYTYTLIYYSHTSTYFTNEPFCYKYYLLSFLSIDTNTLRPSFPFITLPIEFALDCNSTNSIYE